MTTRRLRVSSGPRLADASFGAWPPTATTSPLNPRRAISAFTDAARRDARSGSRIDSSGAENAVNSIRVARSRSAATTASPTIALASGVNSALRQSKDKTIDLDARTDALSRWVGSEAYLALFGNAS